MTAGQVLYRFTGLLKRAGFLFLDVWRRYFVISWGMKANTLFVGARHHAYINILSFSLWEKGRMEGAYVLDFRAPRKNPKALGFATATVVALREGEVDRAAGLLKAARSHLVMLVGADLGNPRLREALKNALSLGRLMLVVAAVDAPREVREMFPRVVDTDWC